MKTIFCFDIDGTLADIGWRNRIAGKEPDRKNWKKYKKWLKKIQSKRMLMEDKPIPGMRDLVELCKDHAVYITARQNSYRKVTEKWLKKNGFPKLKLYMRPKKCKRTSGDYKKEIIENILLHQKELVHVLIFDDDPNRCIFRAAKQNGWTFLKALSGSET